MFSNPKVSADGSQGLNGSNGYKRSTGFRISRDSGFPMLSGAFKGVGVSIIQKFQGNGMEDFRASRPVG